MTQRLVFFSIAMSIAAGCVLNLAPVEGKACDAAHPCPSSLVCENAKCVATATDGGLGGSGGVGGSGGQGGGSGSETDSGFDAGSDAGTDGGVDSGSDAGSCPDGGTAIAEMCDGVDNDCNGMVDDVPQCIVTLMGAAGGMDYRDGTAAEARYAAPVALAVAPDAAIYVADSYNHVLRRVSPNGDVVTVAGTGRCGSTDGNADAGSLCYPTGVVVAGDGSLLISEEKRIRQFRNGMLSRPISASAALAGCQLGVGPSANSIFRQMAFLNGTDLLIADEGCHAVWRAFPDGGIALALGGGGSSVGQAPSVLLYSPNAVATASDGTFFVAQRYAVMRVTPSGAVSYFVGNLNTGYVDGSAAAGRVSKISAMAVDEDAGVLWLADIGNAVLRRVTLDGGVVTSLWSGGTSQLSQARRNGDGGFAKSTGINGMALVPGGIVFSETLGLRKYVTSTGTVEDFSGVFVSAGSRNGPRTTATARDIMAMEVGPDQHLYFVESDTGRLRRLKFNGEVESLITDPALTPAQGEGILVGARLSRPRDVVFGPDGKMFVADGTNRRVVRVDLDAGTVADFAGISSTTTSYLTNVHRLSARFGVIRDLAFGQNDAGVRLLFLADRDNGVIHVINYQTGLVTKHAGAAGSVPQSPVDGPPGVAQVSGGTSGLAADEWGGVYFTDDNGLRYADCDGGIYTRATFGNSSSIGKGVVYVGGKVYVVHDRQLTTFDSTKPFPWPTTRVFQSDSAVSGASAGWRDGPLSDAGLLGPTALWAAPPLFMIADEYTLRQVWAP